MIYVSENMNVKILIRAEWFSVTRLKKRMNMSSDVMLLKGAGLVCGELLIWTRVGPALTEACVMM